MITKKDKNADRKVRHERVREKVFGTLVRPRLNVYRSTRYIYAQIIDDVSGHTLVSASSFGMRDELKGKNKVASAEEVGKRIGQEAIKAGISEIVFDRGGYIYIGRVQAVAEGARKSGLKF